MRVRQQTVLETLKLLIDNNRAQKYTAITTRSRHRRSINVRMAIRTHVHVRPRRTCIGPRRAFLPLGKLMTYLQREQYSQLRLSTCLSTVRRGDASCLRSNKNIQARKVAYACTWRACIRFARVIYARIDLFPSRARRKCKCVIFIRRARAYLYISFGAPSRLSRAAGNRERNESGKYNQTAFQQWLLHSCFNLLKIYIGGLLYAISSIESVTKSRPSTAATNAICLWFRVTFVVSGG